MNENIDVLQEVLDLLQGEKKKYYDLVSQNDFKIEEINSYLRELSEKENDDFKVFSPRNVENMHREQIEADTSEKKKYEEENIEYNQKIEALKVLIDKVNIVIGNLQIESEKYEIENEEGHKFLNEKSEMSDYVDKDNNPVDNADKTGYEKELNIVVNNIEPENLNLEEVINNSSSLEKTHITHQILNCVSFITSDAERAKIELTALAKKMIEH